MRIIRTFHPIGQGAFYIERHKLEMGEFTIVYDCGSTTLKGKNLEKKIKSTFPKNQSIDILFISHFHADHINGIEILAKHCKIKRVVLPLIDDEAKVLLKVANLIENNFYDTRLIDNPQDFFGEDVSIIQIEPTDINPNSDGVSLNNPIGIDQINGSTISSGAVLNTNANPDWFFIPFNYKHETRKIQFENELKAYKLKLSDIDTINKINKHKNNIIKAYKKVDGDLNKNSMILFSGKNKQDDIRCSDHCYFSWYLPVTFQSGCLYMGDIDLNEPTIIVDIRAKLKNMFPFIGTLQVPHHGAILNFNNSILQKEMRCAIFSYGTNNNYGHPSDRVIGDIMANNIYPHFVTEEQKSIVIQWK